MSDFRYLDYEGLATYTEHVKGYADGKIVYISDESEIPDPPKEGTLYVIGSEILMDEEIIIGTQTSTTSSWTGKSIDTRLHNGKRIAYYLPYPSVEGSPVTLSLELSDEDNTITPASRILTGGGYFNNAISGGSVIRMTYFENAMMNGSTRNGWICDGNIIQNNVTYTGTLVDEQVATFEGSTGTIKASGYTIAKSVPSNAKFTDTVYTHPTTAGNKHIPSGGSANQYLKYSSSGTAVWANPEYQFYDYGNLYTGGTSSDHPKIPTSLQLSGNVKFVDGGRLIVKFKNNYSVELELGEGLPGLSSIIFPDGTSMSLTYGKMTTTGYQETHMGDHYLDIIMDDSSGTEYGYLTGYSVPVANYASSAGTASNVSYGNVVYCECSTAAATAAKIATVVGLANFNLHKGAVAYVRFTNSNASSTISLNVGNTGSKYVKYGSVACNGGNAYYPSWSASDMVPFVYDGTYWNIVAPTIDKKTNPNV